MARQTSTPLVPRRSPRKGVWPWPAILCLALLFLDLATITAYVWQLPDGLFDTLKKTLTTVGGWIIAVTAWLGIRHTVAKKQSFRDMLGSAPVLTIVVLTTTVLWAFALPFHSVDFTIRNDSGSGVHDAKVRIDNDANPRADSPDATGKVRITGLLATPHIVKVEASGYYAASFALGFLDVLRFGVTFPVELRTATRVIHVTSSPAGASVFLDGGQAETARTPVDLPLRPGKHSIRLELSRYLSMEAQVDLAPDRDAEFHRELARKSERLYPLHVAATPTAEIFVDGNPRGMTNATIPLSAGNHVIELRANGQKFSENIVMPQRTTVAHVF